MSENIWIIIPVHNRRETTRACLSNLRALGELEKYQVCVVDDASTDGTAEMLAAEYPKIKVIQGNGHLYWGGGIATGMAAARAAKAEVHVWLNDDCLPDENSIACVVERAITTRGMCGGICRDSEDPTLVTYSGSNYGVSGLIQPLPGQYEAVDIMNGNLVAIHAEAVERVGILDSKRFPHYGGDIAYCFRAKAMGLATEVAGSATAVNHRGRPLDSFGVSKPASAIFKEPFRLASSLYWPTHWQVLRLCYGWKAYIRWPAYFLRLIGLWRQACAREKSACATVSR